MKPEQIEKLIRAFDEQQEIIKRQNGIIDSLFELLAEHISSEELAALPVMKEIENVAKMTT